MIRVAMTLPKELVNELDEVLKAKGYTSRRNGLQDVIGEYITQHK